MRLCGSLVSIRHQGPPQCRGLGVSDSGRSRVDFHLPFPHVVAWPSCFRRHKGGGSSASASHALCRRRDAFAARASWRLLEAIPCISSYHLSGSLDKCDIAGQARRDPSRSFASDDDNNAASMLVQRGLQHTLTNASTTHGLLFGSLEPSSSWARSRRDTLSHTRWSRAGEDGERSALPRWRQWPVRRRMPTWAKASAFAARKSAHHSKSLQRISPPLRK